MQRNPGGGRGRGRRLRTACCGGYHAEEPRWRQGKGQAVKDRLLRGIPCRGTPVEAGEGAGGEGPPAVGATMQRNPGGGNDTP